MIASIKQWLSQLGTLVLFLFAVALLALPTSCVAGHAYTAWKKELIGWNRHERYLKFESDSIPLEFRIVEKPVDYLEQYTTQYRVGSLGGPDTVAIVNGLGHICILGETYVIGLDKRDTGYDNEQLHDTWTSAVANFFRTGQASIPGYSVSRFRCGIDLNRNGDPWDDPHLKLGCVFDLGGYQANWVSQTFRIGNGGQRYSIVVPMGALQRDSAQEELVVRRQFAWVADVILDDLPLRIEIYDDHADGVIGARDGWRASERKVFLSLDSGVLVIGRRELAIKLDGDGVRLIDLHRPPQWYRPSLEMNGEARRAIAEDAQARVERSGTWEETVRATEKSVLSARGEQALKLIRVSSRNPLAPIDSAGFAARRRVLLEEKIPGMKSEDLLAVAVQLGYSGSSPEEILPFLRKGMQLLREEGFVRGKYKWPTSWTAIYFAAEFRRLGAFDEAKDILQTVIENEGGDDGRSEVTAARFQLYLIALAQADHETAEALRKRTLDSRLPSGWSWTHSSGQIRVIQRRLAEGSVQ